MCLETGILPPSRDHRANLHLALNDDECNVIGCRLLQFHVVFVKFKFLIPNSGDLCISCSIFLTLKVQGFSWARARLPRLASLYQSRCDRELSGECGHISKVFVISAFARGLKCHLNYFNTDEFIIRRGFAYCEVGCLSAGRQPGGAKNTKYPLNMWPSIIHCCCYLLVTFWYLLRKV
mgnify:CR=1 FL=1